MCYGYSLDVGKVRLVYLALTNPQQVENVQENMP